jgi:class 3 adenylate cyclase/tetratricopeptide (TPR) repeat protein
MLFADAPGLGEHADLELDVRAANEFYGLLRTTLEQYGGTVERHAGDAIMAVFGVPAARDDDARRAAAAALHLQQVVASRPGGGALSVGINTGEVLTGDPGSEEELVVGDPVIVCARLQQNASPGEVLIGPATNRLLGAEAVVGEPREIVLRGREGHVTVLPLLGLKASAVRGARAPFVGREAERRMLRACVERTVQSGIVQLVTVLGEAGTGKTRLVDEVLRGTPDVRVVRGTCQAYGGRSRWPLMREIRYVGEGQAEDGPELLRILEEQTPQLAGVRRILESFFRDGEGPMSPDDLAWALATLFRELSKESPVVVVLEDLHVATPTLLDLIPSVIERLDPARVLAVATSRPELLEHRARWGQGLRHVLGVTLRPLSEEEAGRLARHLLPGDRAAARAVREAAGGSPLFLEQLAQARREGTAVVGEVAPSVAAVLAARLDRLPLGARQVLERAAITGSTGVVADLLPLCEGVDVPLELQQLAGRDLLEVQEDRWSFNSELVREAAVNGLARDERAALHEAWGLVLGTRGLTASSGFHLEEASRLLRGSHPERSASLGELAAARLAAAGLRALSGDLNAACDLLERAIALLPPASPRRMNLITELARGLQLTGDLGRARSLLQSAVSRCAELGLAEAAAHARLALTDLQRSTDPERAYAELPGLLAEVLPALAAAGDDRGLAMAYQLQAGMLQYRVRWAAMEAPLQKSLHHAHRSGDRRLVELGQSLLVGSMFHGPMPLDETRGQLEAMLAQPGISPWHHASVSARLAGALALQGDPEGGRAGIALVRETFHDLGRELSVLATAFMSGPIEMLAGAPDRAATVLEEACDGLLAMGDKAFASTLAALLAEAQWRCGNPERAAAAVGLSRRLADIGDVISQVRWRCVQAKLHAVRGNAQEALALSSQAVQLVVATDEVTSQGDVLADAAEVHILLGREQAGRVLLKDALVRYERKGASQAARVVLDRLG